MTVFLGAIGGFLDAHNGAVTAIATVFIGLFTVALVLVSWSQGRLLKRSVEVAKAAADALPAVERAYLYFNGPSTGFSAHWPDAVSENIDAQIGISFSNYGRTPAILKSLVCTLAALDRLPSRADLLVDGLPAYIPDKRALAANDTFGLTITVELRGDCVPRLDGVATSKRPFLIGSLDYEDVFGIENEITFCWSYNWTTGLFYEDDDVPNMNYTQAYPREREGEKRKDK